VWRSCFQTQTDHPPVCVAGVPFVHMQSILTGESHSVEKHLEAVHNPKAVYQDKVNILFSVSPFNHLHMFVETHFARALCNIFICSLAHPLPG
jgi:hypothetical protein